MKVLIADKLDPSGVAALERAGLVVVSRAGAKGPELVAALREERPEILLVRSTKVTAECFAASPHLALVIRAGAGVDTIDVDAASAEGVYVANCPGKNAVAVAELAWALILACDRRVPQQTAELRAGRWNKKEYSKARGLYGGTLGIVGTGTIGCEVARRGKAFGMKVVGWSPSLTPERCEELGIRQAASLDELARTSDVLSIHVAGGAETKGLIGEEVLAAMKPGAILVNTARGSVVDEAALGRVIAAKGLRVGLDVFASEPADAEAPFASDLLASPLVVGSHHVGASTDQAQEAIAAEAVRIAVGYATTGQVLHVVNRTARVDAATLLTVRHKNRPGVLARVFKVLSEAGINVEEMENVVYRGGQAASARIQLARAPTPAQLAEIRGSCEHIIDLTTTPVDAAAPSR